MNNFKIICSYTLLYLFWVTGACAQNQDATDILIGEGSENSIIISPVNPSQLINSNNLDGLVLPWFLSTDQGSTWNTGVHDELYSDPAVGINRSGRIFLNGVDQQNGQSISYSDDNGMTWSHKIIAALPLDKYLLDKNHLTIDNHISSDYLGNIYVGWTYFETPISGGPVQMSRSTDNGVSWSEPIAISAGIDGCLHQGVNLTTAPNGDVYACWSVSDDCSDPTNLAETALAFGRSTNGGLSWNASRIQVIRGIRNQSMTNKNFRHFSWPSMAVNTQDGSIYIVWTNRGDPSNSTAGDPDIYCIRSTNGGEDWGTPIKVNQDNSGKDQWFPWIACDPVSGALTVVYYDTRNSTNNNQAETYISISYDEGSTWQDMRVSDGISLPTMLNFQKYIGDYIGVDIRYCDVIPVWTVNDATSGEDFETYTSPFRLSCPNNLMLCNKTIHEDAMYGVTGTITAAGTGCGTYTVVYHPVGGAQGHCVMRAGEAIVLQDGFVAEQGTEYHAYIEPCDQTGRYCEKSAFGFSKRSYHEELSGDRKDIPNISLSNRDPIVTIAPNPAKGYVSITYRLSVDGNVKVELTDCFGRSVAMIADGYQTRGMYLLKYDLVGLMTGAYYLVLHSNGSNSTRKILIIQ